jgi:hypothetical protein
MSNALPNEPSRGIRIPEPLRQRLHSELRAIGRELDAEALVGAIEGVIRQWGQLLPKWFPTSNERRHARRQFGQAPPTLGYRNPWRSMVQQARRDLQWYRSTEGTPRSDRRRIPMHSGPYYSRVETVALMRYARGGRVDSEQPLADGIVQLLKGAGLRVTGSKTELAYRLIAHADPKLNPDAIRKLIERALKIGRST